MIWSHRKGCFEPEQLSPGNRPLLMGILNVTPDSFSDGGEFHSARTAVPRALDMLEQGADIIDVGGESTRPGSSPVSADEELSRVIPVIQGILEQRPETVISIDTYKAAVARQACDAGAVIINDVGAGLWDNDMINAVRDTQAGYVCMHSLGKPDTMQNDPHYGDVVGDILMFLLERKAACLAAGIQVDKLVFDPGLGFGKTVDHNLELVRRARDFQQLHRPILWGLSRKSFLYRSLDNNPDFPRLGAALACLQSIQQAGGMQIWRIHDVPDTARFLHMQAVLANKP